MVADAALVCACGATLADGLDDRSVLFGDRRIAFQRATDHVGCPRCGALYRVSELRERLGAVADDPD